MHPVVGGPRIPNDVLSAQEGGTLAIICGAGVSRPNGLPLFDGLVREVWRSFGSDCLLDVADAMNRDEYDRAMGYLEKHYGIPEVRGRVQGILGVPDDPDVSTHEALIDLATDREGRLHLVTTNFDLLFEASGREFRSARAPALPVPKPEKWDGLCYLHGRFDDADPEGRHLVMNSADFGTAYLSERWASRFVTDLFAHFTVLFVGYSINDPVMRYLVDAIAAERASGRLLNPVYAFVGRESKTTLEDVEAEWASKNVVPIPYDIESGQESAPHGILHAMLRQWASIYRGGLSSKKNVVYKLGTQDPDGLEAEDRSRFIWAIQDPDAARHLAKLGAQTSFKWVDFLGENLDKVPIEAEYTASLVGYGSATQEPPPLGDVPRALVRWIAAHAGTRECVEWAVRKGWRLHPETARQVEYALKQADPPVSDGIMRAWTAILGSDVLRYSSGVVSPHFHLVGALPSSPWGPDTRRSVLRALEPGLTFSASLSRLFGSGNGENDSDGDPAVHDLIQADVELAARDSTRSIVEALLGRDDRDEVLVDLADDLTSLLRASLDALATVNSAGSDWDPGSVSQSSIAPHPQNSHPRRWAWLIELNREAFDAMLRVDRERAEAHSVMWTRIAYPTFRRLAMYAMGELLKGDDS